MRGTHRPSRTRDRRTGREDTRLTEWTWEAMESSAFGGIIPSDREYLVRSYHDEFRASVPVMTLDRAPASGTMAQMNARMLRSVAESGETAPAVAATAASKIYVTGLKKA